jgi:hypothetical protein
MLIPSTCTLRVALSSGSSAIETFAPGPSSIETLTSGRRFRFVPDVIEENALIAEDNKLVLGVLGISGPSDISGRV